VDEGVLVKTGSEVLVSVRRALHGADLGQLRTAVVQDFLTQNAQEQDLRAVLARLEAGFMHRFAGFEHE
jgi:F-type H+-transporting ATPase subunit epsilon